MYQTDAWDIIAAINKLSPQSQIVARNWRPPMQNPEPLQPGIHVRLQAFDGEIVRRLVEDQGDVLLITRDEEWEKAEQEHREPICAGFQREFLIGVES